MSEDDFHAIGVAVDAPAVNGRDLADALNEDPGKVTGYFNEICRGVTPPFPPFLAAYPSQVPAYETLFFRAATCPATTTAGLNRERGGVAGLMISNQAFVDRLNRQSTSSVSNFCDTLEKSEQIDSAVIGAAAGKLGAGESEAKLIEFGVTLLIKNCTQLLDRVTG